MAKKINLNETLSKLDAALASPNTSFTGSKGRSRRFFSKDGPHNVKLDVTNMLEGSFSNQSVYESNFDVTNYVEDDITRPTIPYGLSEQLNYTTTCMNSSLLSSEDPEKAAQVLFSEFVNIFVSNPSEAQVWQEVSQYEKICAQQANILSKTIRIAPKNQVSSWKHPKVYQQLINERNTWRLVSSLLKQRMEEKITCDEEMLDLENEPLTDEAIVNQLFDGDKIIREAQTIIDWLEKNASDDLEIDIFDRLEYFGDSHYAYEHTLKIINENQLLSTTGGVGNRIVKSLDPDGPLREGKPLHDLDRDDENRLLRCVFACIRAGEIDKAQELCIRSGKHWRAATLEGWKLYNDPNLMNLPVRQPKTGNQFRDVWKATAWSLASDKRLPAYERASYGILCGHLNAVLNVCLDWEDHLWAFTRCLVDHRVEEQLRSSSKHLRSLHPLPKDYPEEKLTLPTVFHEMENVYEKSHENNPYRIIQKYLILNDIHGLITKGHQWLSENPAPHLLRCLTHLLLVLRRLGCIPLDLNEQTTDILHACVKEAMERGDVEQVAWYASVLPEWLQVRCYANFLTNINDDEHRVHALNMASKVGLDTCSITTTVLSTIRLSSTSDCGEGSELLAETNAEDRAKISALDWLLYDKSQRGEALRQGNAMMRAFLVSRNISAATSVLEKLPPDSINEAVKQHKFETGGNSVSATMENTFREYLCLKTFLESQKAFNDWFDHFHQKKPHMPNKPASGCEFPEQIAYDHGMNVYNNDYDRWNSTNGLLAKIAREKLFNVLLFPNGGWMVDQCNLSTEMNDDDDDNQNDSEFSLDKHLDPDLASREPNRSHQLTTLRSIYIPQVTSLLQNVLLSTKQFKECMQIADTVASEVHQLYKVFTKSELERFFSKVTECVQDCLENKLDVLGYAVQ